MEWAVNAEFSMNRGLHEGEKDFFLTQAQWEYACRSGGKAEKYAGGDDVGSVAWYLWDNAGEKTHPVATKAPNGLDLHDMSGNVWEWCEDVYDSSAYGKNATRDPVMTSGGSGRVTRGGLIILANSVRCTYRHRGSPDFRDSFLGLRLLRPR